MALEAGAETQAVREGPRTIDVALISREIVGRWRVLAMIILALWFIGSALILLILPDQYTATVRILAPNDRSNRGILGEFTGIANSMGIGFGGQGSEFDQYPAIVESRALLDSLLRHGLPVDGKRIDLPTSLGIEAESRDEALQRTYRILTERVIVVRTDRKTMTLEISVTMGSPEEAAALANALADGLDRFNRRNINRSAADRRRFLGARVKEIQASLEQAERSLQAFQEQNRMMQSSPALQLEESRLAREVSLQAVIFTELKRQQEIERIEEMRNTRTIDVLDRAAVPAFPSGPPRFRMMLLAGLLSVVGVTGVFSVLVLRRYALV